MHLEQQQSRKSQYTLGIQLLLRDLGDYRGVIMGRRRKQIEKGEKIPKTTILIVTPILIR